MIAFKRYVSTIWASIKGAVTLMTGSLPKKISPSGIDHTSPVNRRSGRWSRKASSKSSSERR